MKIHRILTWIFKDIWFFILVIKIYGKHSLAHFLCLHKNRNPDLCKSSCGQFLKEISYCKEDLYGNISDLKMKLNDLKAIGIDKLVYLSKNKIIQYIYMKIKSKYIRLRYKMRKNRHYILKA